MQNSSVKIDVILALLVMVCLLFVIPMKVRYDKRATNWDLVQAKVVDTKRRTSRRIHRTFCSFQLQYSHSGRVFVKRFGITQVTLRCIYYEGDTIELYVNPDDPTIVQHRY